MNRRTEPEACSFIRLDQGPSTIFIYGALSAQIYDGGPHNGLIPYNYFFEAPFTFLF